MEYVNLVRGMLSTTVLNNILVQDQPNMFVDLISATNADWISETKSERVGKREGEEVSNRQRGHRTSERKK